MFMKFKSIYPKVTLFWSHICFVLAVTLFAYMAGREPVPLSFFWTWTVLFGAGWIFLQIYFSDREPTVSMQVELTRISFLLVTPAMLAVVAKTAVCEGQGFVNSMVMATYGTVVGYILIFAFAIMAGALQEGFVALWNQGKQQGC